MKTAIDNKNFQQKIKDVYQKVKPDVDPGLIDLKKKEETELLANEVFVDGMEKLKRLLVKVAVVLLIIPI